MKTFEKISHITRLIIASTLVLCGLSLLKVSNFICSESVEFNLGVTKEVQK